MLWHGLCLASTPPHPIPSHPILSHPTKDPKLFFRADKLLEDVMEQRISEKVTKAGRR